jgi:hypothetical protein
MKLPRRVGLWWCKIIFPATGLASVFERRSRLGVPKPAALYTELRLANSLFSSCSYNRQLGRWEWLGHGRQKTEADLRTIETPGSQFIETRRFAGGHKVSRNRV